MGLIAAYLKQNPSPYFVDFTYLENELWVQTDNDEGQGYPVVLMEWVEGKTLDNYLEQICTQNNTPALQNLYFEFCNLAWWLQQQPIAHGDIKHDNLIVTTDGKLKLIDYDGVFVPALRGRKANEMGSPCYQHPKREAYFFDKNLDDFSLLVLQITLLALQQQPKLFTEHYNGDGIILKDTDYQNFAQSRIKTILWQLPEVKILLLLSLLQGSLNNFNAIDLMPLLQDVAWINWLVDGQNNAVFEAKIEDYSYGTSFGSLTTNAVKFLITETNMANSNTKVIITTFDSVGSKTTFLLSEELSKKYYASPINFNQLCNLSVGIGVGEDGKFAWVIHSPEERISINGNWSRANAKPYVSKNAALTEEQLRVLTNAY